MADRFLFRRTEKLAYAALQRVRAPGFAFPENECCPSVSLEQIHVVDIPLDVPVELPVPEFAVGSGSSAPWTIVLMPEATVDENYLLVSGKYKVRCSRKIPAVQPKSESESMRDFTHSNFRHCVAASYATHQPTPLGRRKVVRHVGISVCGSPFGLLPLYMGRQECTASGGPVRCRVHLPCKADFFGTMSRTVAHFWLEHNVEPVTAFVAGDCMRGYTRERMDIGFYGGSRKKLILKNSQTPRKRPGSTSPKRASRPEVSSAAGQEGTKGLGPAPRCPRHMKPITRRAR